MACTHKNNALSFLVSVAVARSKGIVFLFAYWGVYDCFCGKVDAIDFNQR